MRKFTSLSLTEQEAPLAQEHKELTQLNLVEKIEKAPVVSSGSQDPDPYLSKIPTSIVSREFLIKSLTLLTETQEVFYPWKLLLQNKTVLDYLKVFRLFRSDMKLRIVMLSSAMQYGVVMVSYLPYMSSATSHLSLAQQSQSNAHMLSINQQDGCEIFLPYMNPKQYFDLENARGSTPSYAPNLWRVCVNNLDSRSLTTDTPTSLKFNVFASFENPAAAGYIQNEANFQSGIFSEVAQTVGTVAGDWLLRYSRSQGAAMLETAMDSGAAKLESLFYSQVGDTNPESVPQDSQKMQFNVLNDISAPFSKEQAMSSKLGDCTKKQYKQLPKFNNVTSISRICTTPTYIGKYYLSSAASNFEIDLNPLLYNTRAKYLSKCFKYWRGSMKVILGFYASPLTATRLQITMSPTGAGANDAKNVGDLPTWIQTIKGDSSWDLCIPFLQTTEWCETDMTNCLIPKVMVNMLDPLPQPFDKTVGVTTLVYLSCGDDFCFAGMQSCVPSTIPALEGKSKAPRPQEEPMAEFQSGSLDAMMKMVPSPRSNFRSFQGGIIDIRQILSRFSSRNPTADKLFPFPLEIADATALLDFDNFDYLANLFKFYSGDTLLKVLFSKSPVSGRLVIQIRNSKEEVSGSDFKTGNSMAVTTQAVWPVIDICYPFQSTVEFDSLWEPLGMYGIQFDAESEVGSFYLAASPDFALKYLMPVPDFAEFQSARFVGHDSVSGFLDVAIAAAGVNYPVFTPLAFSGVIDWDLHLSVERLSGNSDQPFLVQLATADLGVGLLSNPTGPTSNVLCSPVSWRDENGSGTNVKTFHLSESLQIDYSTSSVWLNIRPFVALPTSSFRFFYSVTRRPWSQSVILVSPQITSDCVGRVALDPLLPANVNVVSIPPVQVSNLYNPHPIQVTNQPIDVQVTASVATGVVIENVPLPVDITSSIELPSRVQGVVAPDTPVFVSNYF